MKIHLGDGNRVEIAFGPEKRSVRLRLLTGGLNLPDSSEVHLTAREAATLADCLHEAARTVNAHTKAQR